MAKYTTEFRKSRLVYTDNNIFRQIRIEWLASRRRRINRKLLKMGVMQVFYKDKYLTLKEYKSL